MKNILKKTIEKNRSLIFNEVHRMQDFMAILMKHRNTGAEWTKEDLRKIKSHLIYLSLYVPVLIVFLLPFGSLLLPILAEIVDRRKHHSTRDEDKKRLTAL
jgi:hypothetical protein